MPLYDFACDRLHRFERMVKLADFSLPQLCICGAPAKRLLSTPQFNVENVEYDCPRTGKMITSRHAHEENLRLHGARVWESGETDELERRKVASQSSFERSLDDAVDAEWEAMPSAKREQLTNELEYGIDLSYEREAK